MFCFKQSTIQTLDQNVDLPIPGINYYILNSSYGRPEKVFFYNSGSNFAWNTAWSHGE